jgi:hypothetical protein
MVDDGDALLVTTEVESLVEISRVEHEPESLETWGAVSAGASKHAALAVNMDGEVLVAWVEGAPYGASGTLKWRLYGGNGKAADEAHAVGKLPVWSFPAVVAREDGGFLVFR